MQTISHLTLTLLIPFPQFPVSAVKKSWLFCPLSLHDYFASSLRLKMRVCNFPICLGFLQME